MIVLYLLVFGLAWWLGLYLVVRDWTKPLLWWAGGGLVAFAAAVVWPVPALVCVPALAWTGVILCLLGARWWIYAVVPVFALALWVPWIVLVPLAIAFALALRSKVFLSLVTVMFGLGAGAFLLQLLPPVWSLPLIGVDLIVLGVVVAVTDAVEAGEAIRADMVRSLVVSVLTAALFGGQVALFLRPGMEPLLYGTVAAAIAVQVLASPIASAVDRLAVPRVAAERAELREAADALPRRAPSTLDGIGADEFARLTRRALTHYGDLGKLVASPLTALPSIDQALPPLERAAELKRLLLKSILRLKPRTGDFGTSDEWRHYNALYFYYVAGIRPYSVRTKRADLDPVAKQALSWFVTQVPERTLHNWQNAAARLVAADLMAGVGSV
ncbi:hypothetical protein Lesp02_76120 [Lentzea sp. NBRC 105346]|uniref:hypothetical protein n=1 Tax=Lentzea sp. NBRC 105346 TaxID=3032205 RepID=UPI0024A135F8|nr:hypothetical protein [Lentzea sp. NBRC 105346]GLZ35425.1 hypothetical protein Lesp02_76120 [Lentzea sp. NBRC 105346]